MSCQDRSVEELRRMGEDLTRHLYHVRWMAIAAVVLSWLLVLAFCWILVRIELRASEL